MDDAIDIQNENNDNNVNETIRGFSLDALNNMVYRYAPLDDHANEFPENINNIQSNYVLPKNRSKTIKGMRIMCFNIRSMCTNFDSFVAELMDSNTCDVIGLCETKLIDSLSVCLSVRTVIS